MKRGDKAILCIKKVLQAGHTAEHLEHTCEVLHYDDKEEMISFLQMCGKLTDLSLDAIYECRIQSDAEEVSCTGRITERYSGEEGKTFRLKIENGFYKKI